MISRMLMATARIHARLEVLYNGAREANVRIALARRSAARGSRNDHARARFLDARRDRRSSIAATLRLAVRLRAGLAAGAVLCRYLLNFEGSSFEESAYRARAKYETNAHAALDAESGSRIYLHLDRANDSNARAALDCRLRKSDHLEIRVLRIRSRLDRVLSAMSVIVE